MTWLWITLGVIAFFAFMGWLLWRACRDGIWYTP